MIKYKIKRYESTSTGARITFNETIKKSELNWYLENGWTISEKIIPAVTPTLKWWNKFSTDQKLNILNFLIPSLIALFFGVLAYYSNKENDTLKQDSKILNENYYLLENKNIYLIDSISKLNKTIDSISQNHPNKTIDNNKNPDRSDISNRR